MSGRGGYVKIAICDDDSMDVQSLKDMLTQMAGNCVIECFSSGQAFMKAAQERRYDLVFMDVYLNGENGIDVIRAMKQGTSPPKVVFTTCSDAHAVEAFSVRALHYLVKPITTEDVAEVLDRMRSAGGARQPDSTLTVRIGNDIYTLNQSDIVRVESDNHKTNIHMKNGFVYSIWVPFRKVREQLDSFFLTVSRGVAVNMRFIVKWQATNCVLTDGTGYLLSRNNRQQIKEAYFNFKQNELLSEQTHT